MRARTTAGPIAIDATGRMKDENPDSPATGTQCRVTANAYTRPTASRKPGIAASRMLTEVKASSVPRRRPLADDLRHRQPRGNRRAEPAGEQVPQVVDVLQPQGIVEAERGSPGVDQLLRGGKAERGPDGVAGGRVDYHQAR